MKNTIIITAMVCLILLAAFCSGCATKPATKSHVSPWETEQSKFEKAVEKRLSATEKDGNPVNRRILWTLAVKYQESKRGH